MITSELLEAPEGHRAYPLTKVRQAHLWSEGPYLPPEARDRAPSPAQLSGLKHERRVHKYLEQQHGEFYLASPWIRYATPSWYWRWCQPDGLIFLPARGTIILVEAKIRHCAQAYFQTENLYLPVLRVLFPYWEFAICEIVRWYDPSVNFPRQPEIVEEPVDSDPSNFSVFIIRGHHMKETS